MTSGNGLDQIHHDIGELQAGLKSHEKRLEQHEERVDDRFRQLREDHIRPMSEKVADMHAFFLKAKGVRWAATVVISTIGALFALGGWLLGHFFGK